MSNDNWKSPFIDGTPFDRTKSFALLKKLSQHPYDLTKEGALTNERITSMKETGVGFTLLYGFERVTEEVMGALFQLAKERRALDQMIAMQSGEAINFIEGYESENRAVLHTATRDLFQDPYPSEKAKNARNESLQEHEKLKSFLEGIEKEGRFTNMVLIGIGGSELGPKALLSALSLYRKPKREVRFISNIDPDDVVLQLQDLDLSKTLVVVVSKSGTTLETATNEEFVRSRFVKAGLHPRDHFIAVTMPKTPMDDETKYRAAFHLWDYVGGRYSATSMVGGLVLSFAIGYREYLKMLEGAHHMDVLARSSETAKNLPLLLALLGIWNRNFLGYPTVAIIPYAQVLHRFPAHLQQCDMESNGKRIDRRGNVLSFETSPVIWGEPGTNAQHSFYQNIHQGTSIIPLELIAFVESQGEEDFEWKKSTSQEKLLSNFFAQAIGLATGQGNSNPNKVFPGNRPSALLIARKLDPFTLGALLALYEHKIAFQGFIWGINSFDQEGVQLGKKLADRCFGIYAAEREKKKSDPFPVGDALLALTKAIQKQ